MLSIYIFRGASHFEDELLTVLAQEVRPMHLSRNGALLTIHDLDLAECLRIIKRALINLTKTQWGAEAKMVRHFEYDGVVYRFFVGEDYRCYYRRESVV